MFNRALRGAKTLALRTLFATACVSLFCSIAPAYAQSATLTLNDVLRKALAADYTLPAAKSRIRGAEAGVRQANRMLNPTIGVEVENFGGSGQYRGLNRNETTGFVQQIIELGNKREARTDLARTEVRAVEARGAVRVLDFLREVELVWIDVQVASAQVKVAETRLAVATQFRDEIARRSQAGRDPQYAQNRADAQVALEQISVDQAKTSLNIARTNLASYWRGSPDFDVDTVAFEDTVVRFGRGGVSAELAVSEADRQTAAARVGVERARAVPDPAVRVGVRRFGETSDAAVVAGISIPLQLFDTNKDNIARAEAERQAAELDVQTVQRGIRREFTRLKGRMTASATEARRIDAEVIPQADRAVQSIRSGLERGAFSYIEFADAQRTLNDARLRRIDALRTFHQDNAALARLTGSRSHINARKPKR